MTLIPPHVTLQELEDQLVHVDQMKVGETLEPVRKKLSELIAKNIERIRTTLTPKQDDHR